MDALKTHTFAQPERHPLMDFTNHNIKGLDYSKLDLDKLWELRDAHTREDEGVPADLDAAIVEKGGIIE